MTTDRWRLACSECAATSTADGLPTVCPDCGAPWLVEYAHLPDLPASLARAQHGTAAADDPTTAWSMWRYRAWMPMDDGEEPVTTDPLATPAPGTRCNFPRP